jgi:ATP-dependent Clp protease adaptor protein ClpS
MKIENTTKEKNETKNSKTKKSGWVLILGNDDYNTFDWVIDRLMVICGHTVEQATQCAYIVHFRGECDVKYGDFETISSMKEKLILSGLKATMEEN